MLVMFYNANCTHTGAHGSTYRHMQRKQNCINYMQYHGELSICQFVYPYCLSVDLSVYLYRCFSFFFDSNGLSLFEYAMYLKCEEKGLRRRRKGIGTARNLKQVGKPMFAKSMSRKKERKKKAYRCSKFNAYCLLSCRDNSQQRLCRPTVTLHQGQGHRNEHENMCQA